MHSPDLLHNGTHQRAGAIDADFKTDPTAGSVACDGYPQFLLWRPAGSQQLIRDPALCLVELAVPKVANSLE